MSRNLIVGLAILVVAIFAWIVIGRLGDGEEVADAPVDAPLTTTEEAVEGTDEVAVVPDPDTQPIANEEAVVEGAEVEVDEAAEAVEDTAGNAADATGDALTDAGEATANFAEDAADATADAADATVDAAGDAVEATQDAAESATDAAAGAVDDAADATGEAVEETADVATDAGDAVTEDAAEAGAEVEAAAEEAPLADGEVDGVEAEVTTSTVAIEPIEGADVAAGDRPELETLLTEEGFDADALTVYVEESDMTDEAKEEMRGAIEEARDDASLVPALIEDARAELVEE